MKRTVIELAAISQFQVLVVSPCFSSIEISFI